MWWQVIPSPRAPLRQNVQQPASGWHEQRLPNYLRQHAQQQAAASGTDSVPAPCPCRQLETAEREDHCASSFAMLGSCLVQPVQAAESWLQPDPGRASEFSGTFIYERNGSFSTHAVWHKGGDETISERLLQLDGPAQKSCGSTADRSA